MNPGGGGGGASGGSGSGSGGGSGSSGGGGGGGSVVYPSRPVGSYDSVVGYAMSRIGCPYIWGAEGPDSFDCSGLVTWAYRQVGMYLPHQSEAQYAAAARVVSVSEARPVQAARTTCTLPPSTRTCATPIRCRGRSSRTRCSSKASYDH